MNDELAQLSDDLACTEVVELVTYYLEGTLPEAERRRVAAHLHSCSGCGEYFDQIKTVAGTLGGLRDEAIPHELRDSLIASFREFRER